jgi:hypothetical protein
MECVFIRLKGVDSHTLAPLIVGAKQTHFIAAGYIMRRCRGAIYIGQLISGPTEKLSRRCALPTTIKITPILWAQRSAAAGVGLLRGYCCLIGWSIRLASRMVLFLAAQSATDYPHLFQDMTRATNDVRPPIRPHHHQRSHASSR